MTAASIYGSPPKLLCGGKSARRTRFPWGETGVLGEVTDRCSRGAWRGMGPSTYARVAEITSGRTISQQGRRGAVLPARRRGAAPGCQWQRCPMCRTWSGWGACVSQRQGRQVATQQDGPAGGQRGRGVLPTTSSRSVPWPRDRQRQNHIHAPNWARPDTAAQHRRGIFRSK